MIESIASKILNKKISTIVFDLDGTLYSSKSGIENEIKPSMWKTFADELNIPIDQAKKLMWQLIQKYEDEAFGLMELNINLEHFYGKVYNNLDLSKIEPYPKLEDEIAPFQNHTSLILFTNSSIDHAHRVLNLLNLNSIFSKIVSFENNNYVRKPDRRAFLGLLGSLGVNPSEILYFDDSMPNLWIAHKMGFNTILVSNGLVEPPSFMEMHMRVKHEPPEFVTGFTYNIVDFLSKINQTLNDGK